LEPPASSSSSSSSGSAQPTRFTTWSGTTFAPNGTLAVPNVRVYWTRDVPAALPSGASCSVCSAPPAEVSTTSGADGTFQLQVPVAEPVFLVVQHGSFRRVRQITVAAATTSLESTFATLPGANSAELGDTAPKIALLREVTDSVYDEIQVLLGELGITEWTNFNEDHARIKSELAQYSIAFFPSGSPNPPDDGDRQALRAFVAGGGLVYASDFAHAYVDSTFPEFFGAAMVTESPSRSRTGSYVDPGLRTFLTHDGDAVDHATFETIWTSFRGVHSAQVPPRAGSEMVTATPKVWATFEDANGADTGEAAVSFAYGCGHAFVTTFFEQAKTSGLIAQERALLYALLDLNSCTPSP
jgi:hypothetical protein